MNRTQAVSLAFAAAVLVLGFATLAETLFDDARVQQAFVAGSFLAAGWLAAFAFRQLNELLERNQRSKDVQEAFRAEIFDYSEAMDDDDPDDTARRISERVRKGGNGARRYHPLVPRVSPPVVFEALAQDIHLLPQATIDSVVQFYSVLSDVTVFAEDLMSDAFVAAEADSRANALRDYMEMRGTLLKLSRDAIDDLDRSLTASGPGHRIGVWLGVRRIGAADA